VLVVVLVAVLCVLRVVELLRVALEPPPPHPAAPRMPSALVPRNARRVSLDGCTPPEDRCAALCDAGAVAMRLAILASGAGTTAQAVFDACAQGRIDGSVVLVISNNAQAPVLDRAQAAGIPSRHLSARTHPEPEALERALLDSLRDAGATHVLLAGYMKKLGASVLAAYPARVYNTHPALLPAYGGRGMYGDRVHAAVLADGRERSGATVHVVTEDYDEGPILAAIEVPVLPGDDVASLGERVRGAERELVVEVLAGIASEPVA
jgi:phosphoribosylglycinamide formyltransferase-1